MTAHDVAIYTASAATAGLYDRSHGRAGGAERQMTLLARTLVHCGLRVAHVTYPAKDPIDLEYPVRLVHRAPYAGGRRLVGPLAEAIAIWRALAAADASVVVVRSASPAVGVAALFCTVRRRAFVFSSSNVSDFNVPLSGRFNAALYRLGVRRAAAIVVQSEDQRRMVIACFPRLRTPVHVIPSFADAGHDAHSATTPDSFLWFGRAVPHKQPLKYLELARSLPEARFSMIPVPDGPSTPVFAELARQAPAIPNLTILAPVPHAELGPLIARSVAVVNTSSHEGMPNAFLEAWASGVPVLTLEFDPDDVVATYSLGFSADGSWTGFLAAARKLWADRSNREDVRRRVQEYVSSTHSPERVGAQWVALVRDLAR